MIRVGIISALVLLGTSTAWAEDKVQPKAEECQSCTARHKSLQRLQDLRLPPAPKTDDLSSQAKKDDAEDGEG